MSKLLLARACFALSLCFSLASQAAELIIVNDTNYDSTSILNDGPCSTILGDAGLTPARMNGQPSIKVVTESLLKKGCVSSKPARKNQPWNCKADVYVSNNCTSNTHRPIGTVYLNVNEGLLAVTMGNDIDNPEHYVIWFDPENRFKIVITDGMMWQNWIKQTFKKAFGAVEKAK